MSTKTQAKAETCSCGQCCHDNHNNEKHGESRQTHHEHGHHEHGHHEHTHSEHSENESANYHEQGCACGHEHSHDTEQHKHEHKHTKLPEFSCGCGCNDDDKQHSHGKQGSHSGHDSHDGHSHDNPASRLDWILWSGGVLLFVLAILLPVNEIIKAILFGVSVAVAGWELMFSGIKEIIRFKLQENSLLLIAVVASFVLGEYPEACVVTLLFRLGGFLEAYAIAKSRKSMEALSQIRPETATVKNNAGEYIQRPAEAMQIDDIFYIRAGDRVALDCEVTEGFSTIDSSALTGESLPVSAEPGDVLLSGSVNLTGLLTCRVKNTFENSAASQIIEMVYASTQKKGKAENLVSRFAKYYTPAVVIIALLIAVLPPLLSLGSFPDFIGRALIFLVASCPCSLVISIPLTFFSAIGATSKAGVLVKGSLYIEKLSRIKAVCLDKTGTLTSGKMTVDRVVSLSDLSENEILLLCSGLEAASSHPIAKSIVSHASALLDASATNADISFSELSERPGMGVSGLLNGGKPFTNGSRLIARTYYCGGPRVLKELGIENEDIPAAQVYLCTAEGVLGAIILKEEIPEQSLTLSKSLRAENVEHIVMLTGDNQNSAKAVADACGITEYHAGLLPADKVTKLEAIRNAGSSTLFVGDGINDAPVLAAADLGVSMGLGSEIANASSDVILVSNNLSALPKAIRLAKRGMSIVYFNIGFAFAIKLIVLILGATGYGSMWMAVFADIGVTILSVLNAVRLLRKSGAVQKN